MNDSCRKPQKLVKCELGNLVKIGLLKELYRQHHITQSQFERLMRLQRT